jgi:hypothetical protein
MEYKEELWEELVLKVSKHFKVTADFDFMLFMVGVQELGTGMTKYTRDEKWDIINLGKCQLLTLLGYLQQSGKDSAGWPEFQEIKSTKGITPNLMNHLLKGAMIYYFNEQLN